MAFADVMRRALQPSVLDLDPAFARQQFVQDLDERRGMLTQNRAAEGLAASQAHAGTLRDLRSGAHGFGFLRPNAGPEWSPKEPGKVRRDMQGMLEGILREQALAQYDRDAPRERARLAELRGA